MSKELSLGDKIWMYYGLNSLIVGHLVDHSPDFAFVGVCALPFDEYQKLTLEERAGCPITWCETRFCNYLAHEPYHEVKKVDSFVQQRLPRAGF